MNNTKSLVALVAMLALTLIGSLRADAQLLKEPIQQLRITYPTQGAPLVAGAADSVYYKGIVYVNVTPTSPDVIAKYGAKPLVSEEYTPGLHGIYNLPVGFYEVSFGMRIGTEVHTFIVRDVNLRQPNSVIVELDGTSKTTIVGGDMTVRDMIAAITKSQGDIATLQQQVAALTSQVSALTAQVAALKAK
jgi:hypothetical protein